MTQVRTKTMRGLAAAIASAALLVGAVASPAPAGPKTTRFGDRLRQAVPQAAQYPLTWAHPTHEPVSVRQPDGRIIQIRGTDMEVGGVSETTDGYSVMKDARGWWVYALKGANGWEVPTKFRVGVDAVPKTLPKHAARTTSAWIDASGKDLRSKVFKMLSQNQQFLQARARAEANGARTFKIPALMLETHGRFAPESTPDFFEKLLSGTRDQPGDLNPRGTMTELYLEMSWGSFEPIVDVYGPYTSPASLASECFYGRKAPPVDVPDPANPTRPPDTSRLTDTKPTGPPIVATVAGMALEAVPQADPEVNFGDYDNDGDGAVDFLLVIHSGPGREATLDDCHVHSHYFSLATAVTTDVGAAGPVIVQSAMTIPEVDLQIGVAAHEFMHALGEPDYYDTDGTGEGTGEWDLGGAGPWLGFPPQSNTIHFNPFMKVNLGWIKPRVVEKTELGVTLRPRELYKDLIMVPILKSRATNGGPHSNCTRAVPSPWCVDGSLVTEGYLLEYLDRTAHGKPNDPRLPRGGIFDRYAHASGMMAWHFDLGPTVNADETRMRVDLEEADWRDGVQDVQLGLSRGDARDLFWDDATGLSSATVAKVADTGGDGKSQAAPAGSPWTVVSPVAPCAQPEVDCPSHPGAIPVPTWTVQADPDNIVMRVRLDWESNSADDWDLYVDQRQADGSWLQIAYSAGGTDVHIPDTGMPWNETAVVLNPQPGEYRARAVNWLAPTQPQARISVEFGSSVDKLGMPNTLTWANERTGWAFTNIRPAAGGMTVDLVRHTTKTFDLSPEIVTSALPLQAGRPGKLRTRVYNHGGLAVTGVTVTVTDNGAVVGSKSIAKIPGYDFVDVEIPYTPSDRGYREMVATVALKAGEKVTGNNVQRGVLFVGDANARVLIVDDDSGFSLEEGYGATLASLGVPYAIGPDHVPLAEMKRYALVIWNGGSTQRKNSIDPSDRASLAAYLTGGGRLLVGGSMIVRGVNDVEPEWLETWLGLSRKDIWQFGTGPAHGLGLKFDIDLAPGRSLMDELEAVGGTETYRMDPLPAHEPEGTVGVRFAKDKFKTEVQSFSIGQVRDGETRIAIMKGALEYLGIPLGGRAPDSSPLINHAAWRGRLNGQATPVIVGVTDADGVASVTLRYRKIGAKAWVTVPMAESKADGIFEAMIPASAVTPQGLEYKIEATDAKGNTRMDPMAGTHVVASAIGPAFGAYPSIVSPRVKSGAINRPLPATGVGIPVPVALASLAGAMALAILTRRRTA